jgi:hypothetical protein
MAVSDPLVLTIGGSAKSLNKINQDGYGSEWLLREALQEIRAKLRHSEKKPGADGVAYDRHTFDVTITVYATDTDVQYDDNCYVVMERRPKQTDVDLPDAIADLLIASTDAFLLKMNTWQT